MKILLAITGASGSLYAWHFLRLLHSQGHEVHAIISEAGKKVLTIELGMEPDDLDPYVTAWYDLNDMAAPVASGSFRIDAMVILPCSMGTLAAIAGGISLNLIHRAADVILKERKILLLAPRETPLNRTHLKNLLKAHEAGAIICPAMPGFYYGPKTLDDLASYFAGRISELIGIEISNLPRWQGG